jgi:hypothetical protein
MHRDEYTVYVGLDWGSDTHHVCALDAERHVRGQRRVEHSAPGLAALADWLGTLAPGHPEQIAVALEVPRGAIVDTLLARGLHVFVINPKQLDRFRDRYSMAGAKDDRRDAFVAADALRTDRWAFRRLEPDQPLIVQLRELTRLTEDLQQELTRLANRLRDQLLRFYPACCGSPRPPTNRGCGRCSTWPRRRPPAPTCRAPASAGSCSSIASGGSRPMRSARPCGPRPSPSPRGPWRRRPATWPCSCRGCAWSPRSGRSVRLSWTPC